MSPATDDDEGPSDDRGHSKDTRQVRHYWRRNDEDVKRWAELFQKGITIVHIAERYNVAPSTIAQQLHKLGFTITKGHHMVEQLPLSTHHSSSNSSTEGPKLCSSSSRTVFGESKRA